MFETVVYVLECIHSIPQCTANTSVQPMYPQRLENPHNAPRESRAECIPASRQKMALRSGIIHSLMVTTCSRPRVIQTLHKLFFTVYYIIAITEIRINPLILLQERPVSMIINRKQQPCKSVWSLTRFILNGMSGLM